MHHVGTGGKSQCLLLNFCCFAFRLNIQRSKDSKATGRKIFKPPATERAASKESRKPILITPVPVNLEQTPAAKEPGSENLQNGAIAVPVSDNKEEAPALLSNQNKALLDYNNEIPPGYRHAEGDPKGADTEAPDAREVTQARGRLEPPVVVNPKGAAPDAREHVETIPRDLEQEARDSIKPTRHEPSDQSNIMLPRVDDKPKEVRYSNL